jgi:hypothetical protein
MTTGAHLIACGRKLADAKQAPVAAIVAARARHEQLANTFNWQEEDLATFG